MSGESSAKPEKKATAYAMQKEVDNSRDNSLSIFHALGKFLYNKRIDPKTKDARQMSFKDMSAFAKKPKFYEDHGKLLH
eukprot:CAMPEP_0170487526 /NCGR_PEP_ID=MMETSP0208-20121228/6328_1 /TAXON_ID=197538 /ORGANISM="Strombidium inclinatum, Strain S3" /LENGTH=78 /DNA_ID=CAMNT_0010761843 /DNA_START=129 /DNA_END=365 /DNA_ORIENTATION=+